MGDWVRYKLDRQTDHILVDEAQDTNERQWNIVRALAGEFSPARAPRGGTGRSSPSAITSRRSSASRAPIPSSFDVARAWFAREAAAIERDFLDLSMDRSFRSAPPILAVGRPGDRRSRPRRVRPAAAPNPHREPPCERPGSVTLWFPFTDESAADEDAGEEGWVSDATRRYAARLARQVKAWLDQPFLVESRGRALRPEDIFILVRRRGELAALLVARLHAEGVPVAGVDRLLLSAPLAVQDLLAAARFAAQPLDDLNLAALLVSPLFGWSQDASVRRRLSAARARSGRTSAPGRRRGCTRSSPWPIMRRRIPSSRRSSRGRSTAGASCSSGSAPRRATRSRNCCPPRSSSRATTAASLQAFLDWFARGDVEIVRDPSAPLDAVRVMTVHGAKGLQAPVVILADACANPDNAGPGGAIAGLRLEEGAPIIPAFRPRKDELAEPLKSQIERQDRLDREEHWRLLYVALTRAEERLYIGGALGARDRDGPAQASWYRAVETAVAGLGSDWTRFGLVGVASCASARSKSPREGPAEAS